MKPLVRPLAVSIAGASEITSLSISVLDLAIRNGVLPVRRYGNRTLVLVSELERFLESLPVGRPAAPSHLEGLRSGRPRKSPAEGVKT